MKSKKETSKSNKQTNKKKSKETKRKNEIQEEEIREKAVQLEEDKEAGCINNRNEIELTNVVFPHSLKMLHDPCIWIGDTAANVHATPHLTGNVNDLQREVPQHITVVNQWCITKDNNAWQFERNNI